MLSDIDFWMPFSRRIHLETTAAVERHLAWMRRTGLLRSEAATERYRSWHPAEIAGRWFPAVSGADLDLACDYFGWFFMFDDQFDSARGRDPQTVAAEVGSLADLLHAGPGAALSAGVPLGTALADIWSRLCDGMSPWWPDRARQHWEQYLLVHIQEAANRRDDVWLSVQEYLDVRYSSGFVPPLWDAIERIWRCEVPREIYDSPELCTMRDVANLNICIVNDVYSLAKEEARGDRHNLVLVVERQQACSRAEALESVRSMADGWTRTFLATETQIPGVCDRLGISPESRLPVFRFIEGMRAAIRGNYDWCSSTARYHGRTIPPDQPGYLEDGFTAGPRRDV